MIEGFAREMPEDLMTQAIAEAHEYIREICDLQEELAQKANVVKAVYAVPAPDPLIETLRRQVFRGHQAGQADRGQAGPGRGRAGAEGAGQGRVDPRPATADAMAPERCSPPAWHDLEARVVRELILSGTRPDGRDCKTLRPITCQVDVLPRVHGSAVFQRGETQAMVTVTLGTGRDEQRVDGLVDEYSQKFMLHYYFPSFSVGEVRPIRGPGRREIGHGALAERSVKPVLPDPEDFPYTIRIISDILESNGSSSMASVCGATLGLMAAGVPISNPVAGISIGLVKEADRWTLLTDIIGDEDHYGDMDFKVAGTQNGITGIQLDLKINGISEEIVARHADAGPRGPHRDPAQDAHDHFPAAARDLRLGPAAAADAHRPGEDRPADRAGRQDDPRHPGGHRGLDRGRGRRHRDRGQQRHGRRPKRPCAASRPSPPRVEMGRIYHGPRHQHQGFRRLHRDPARQGRPVPHQRAGRRLRLQRGRRLQGGRRDAGEGHRHRRPGPREAQPQGRAEGAGPPTTRRWPAAASSPAIATVGDAATAAASAARDRRPRPMRRVWQ